MSLRSIIKAALQGIARFVVVSTEVVLNGVRTVIHSLVPARNTAMNDEAEQYLEEGNPGPVLETLAEAKTARTHVPLSEPERVRRAAFELREGRQISPRLLSPGLPAEMEILEWLASLGELQLGFVVRGSDADIAAHLDGEKKLRCPLLPKAQARAEAAAEEKRPLSLDEWIKELMRRAAENEHDDMGVEERDALIEEAKMLADAGATLADYPKTNVSIVLNLEDDG